MRIKGAKILVLGGAGFIGSFVVSALLKEEVGEVVIYDNFASGVLENLTEQLRDSRCSIYPNGGDVRDMDLLDDAMRGMDGVIHLAAMWLLHCRDFPRTAFNVNIEGTFNVLEACVKNNVKCLVYSSSASVYGDAVEMPMTELHPLNNHNFYGASKIAGEAMCRAFHDRYGLSYVGLRYMNVYGPRQNETAAYTGVIPIMLNKIDNGQALIINGDGNQAYDFIYVEDVARCNLMALESGMADEFYNVGTGVQTTIKQLCNIILKLKSSELEVRYQPYDAGDVRSMVRNRIGSPLKAKQHLQFQHTYDLQTGLKELIDWRSRNRIQKP